MIGYLFIFNLTHKTKTATHLDQSTQRLNQQQVLGFSVPYASLRIITKKNAGPKPFC
jgi:hypothetical protein